MGIRTVCASYGMDAARALRAEVAAAKGNEPLAPVTVVVPSNQVGVAARRLLASGHVGSVCGRGTGLAAVTFLTAYRLADLIGAPVLAGAGRRPISTPVLTAAVRASLRNAPGLFEPVAEHVATEGALVATYRELRDPSPAALDAIAARSERAADVVRLHRAVRARLEPHWYDEEDLMDAAVEALPRWNVRETIGSVVVHLPQRLSRHAAQLLQALAEHTGVTVVVGVTGNLRADDEVMRSVQRLGIRIDETTGKQPTIHTSIERTRFFTASDADDEVREAVRAIVDAARAGTPLDRLAILHASPQPYDRLIRDQLSAADVPVNGATEVAVAARVAGRTLLHLLELPALGYRRQDAFAWLTSAPVRHRGQAVPVTSWERLSRDAGVVAGRQDWDELLARLVAELEAKAHEVERDPDQPEWLTQKWLGDAARANDLRAFMLEHIDALEVAAVKPQPWSARAEWARRLLEGLLGGSAHRDAWPLHERKAAERVELALERLAALDPVEPAVDLAVFTRTLSIELESDLGRVGRFGEGVFVGSVGMGVGLDLDLVILLGLAEGSFPAPVRDDSLLPDNERVAASGELALRSQRIDREHREFLAALASAEHHLLGIPRGDLRRSTEHVCSRWAVEVASSLAGERVWSADLLQATYPWIHHIPSFDAGIRRLDLPATDQEHRLRAILAADPPRPDLAVLTAMLDPATASGVRTLDARRSPVFTRFDGNLAGITIKSPVEARMSATRLEEWAGCPQAYFVHRLLGAEKIENPEEELTISALVKGSLIHEVLEHFIQEVLDRPVADQPAPQQRWSPTDHARLRAIGEQRCDRYLDQGVTGRPIFWRRDRSQILRELDTFLVEDNKFRAEHGARPAATELAFGMDDSTAPVVFSLTDGRQLRVRGMADRVDVGDDGTIYVHDYKTGAPKNYLKLSESNPDAGGTKLQLAVYGQAARLHQQAPDAPVEADYWFVTSKGGFKQKGYSVTPDVLAHVTGTLSVIVAGIEGGVFTSHPSAVSARAYVDCHYCDPDGLGRGELRRQWVAKARDAGLAAYVALAEPEALDALATGEV